MTSRYLAVSRSDKVFFGFTRGFLPKLDIPADYNIDYLFFTFVPKIIHPRLISRLFCVRPVSSILCMLLLAGCAVEQNTILSNATGNLAAHYNGYYYARETNRGVEKIILKSLDDDHN